MTRDAFRTVLSELLGVPRGALQDSATRDTIPNWSSLVDVEILSFIASELGVEADSDFLEEFTDCDSVGDLLHLLENKNALSAI